MGSSEIHHLVHQYGLLVVFAAAAAQAVGAPVPGTTVLVAAAIYAAAGHGPPIAGVIIAAAGGALAGMTGGFWVGRRASEARLMRVAARLRIGTDRVASMRRQLAARAGAWVFFSRFITGLRNVGGLLAGASGMPFARFVAFAAAAALVWAGTSGLEYYWFGRAVIAAPVWLQILLVLSGLALTFASLWLVRRRVARYLPIETARAREE